MKPRIDCTCGVRYSAVLDEWLIEWDNCGGCNGVCVPPTGHGIDGQMLTINCQGT